MSVSSLGRIFDAGGKNQIELIFDDIVQTGLTDPVGTDAWTLKAITVNAPKPDLSIFNVPLDLSASATATVGIEKADASFTFFGSNTPLTAPTGMSFASVKVDGTLGVSAKAAAPVGAFQLSGTAASSAAFDYQHLLPVKSTDRRFDAMLALARSAQLPQWASFQKLAPGEVDRFTANFSLDLGVKAKAGNSFDLSSVVSLFDGLSGSVKASVRYSLEAALGWSLYDEMNLTVARALTTNADWVRVRLERANRHALTFNVTFGLQAEYDATDILTVLEKAFQLSPVHSLLETATTVLTTFATGNWTAVQAKISDVIGDRLTTLVGPAWKTWVEGSDEVTKFIAFANEVVTTWNGLDAKVQSLWTDILTKVDAQPGSKFATAVGKIAAIDPATFDPKTLLSAEWLQRLTMVESFTGLNLEDLILGDQSAARRALTSAVNIARQVQSILNGTVGKINGEIDKLAQKYGVTQAINFLAANATSKAQLEASGLAWLQKMVTKLVGKAWSEINEADLAKVQALAQNLQTRVLAVQAKLNAAMKKAMSLAKGNIGFSLAFEVSRVSEFSSLLDFEFNPGDDAVRSRVAEKLPAGSVQALLNELDELKDKNPVPFLIHESVITSRRVRTGGISVFFSAFGLQVGQKIKNTRTESSRIQISDSGRVADYSGGFVQTVENNDAASSECGVWIDSDATSTSLSTAAAYDPATYSMRLTFSRTDGATTARELFAFDRLLEELGFLGVGADPRPSTLVTPGMQTIFSLQLRLGQEAIDDLIADLDAAGLDVDFRNAAHRVFVDGMISFPLVKPKAERGDAIARVILTENFAQTWNDASLQPFIEGEIATPSTLADGTLLGVVADRQIQIPYAPVQMLIQRRREGFDAVGNFAKAFQDVPKDAPTPESLTSLSRIASDSFAATSGKDWDNPAFNLWLVLARLSRTNTATLEKVQGLAQLKWKMPTDSDYGDPAVWQLTTGVPTDLTAGRAFPIAPAPAPSPSPSA